VVHLDALAQTSINSGGPIWTGSDTLIDLITASTNALNGALLVRRPRPLAVHHRRDLLMALGGPLTPPIFPGIATRETCEDAPSSDRPGV
jgi:hypothetical protein